MHGSPGLHHNARPVGRIGTAIRNSSPTLFPVLPNCIISNVFIFHTAYQGKKQDARRYYDDGDRIQPAEWLYTRYVDILPLPENMYSIQWLTTPQFITGTILFFAGMWINWQSDYIVRHLRKPGDTNHYLPKGGMFNYVTSANYFGELVEWCGFAILSCQRHLFCLVDIRQPRTRANTIWHKYKAMFGKEVGSRKRIIPFIY